ncbi:uncharacterized protein N7459_006681 [Penicillium hispanicum]|uniref:uncharacterized protein n=1 Tax=Penicillium hispanicum TaxID=1080232 RepID=UPI002540BAD6|nr:uncharacterized protein N7459_006681 [Penicillium hispanicum]KAJ5577717.1 hypothetical protein N7459_006681 [Penicillium hispanicum]
MASHIYSFLFAPNRTGAASLFYSRRSRRTCARWRGNTTVPQHVRFRYTIQSATYDEAEDLKCTWIERSRLAAKAYYRTCVFKFPNGFVLMGPSTTTGHLSLVDSTEGEINFALRLLGPILHALYLSMI